jgi:pimeloyl-ACP methyl ester carboxylesterase
VSALVLWQAVTQRTAIGADDIAGGFLGTDLGGWLATLSLRIAPASLFPRSIRRDSAAQQRLRALVGTLVPMEVRRVGVENDATQIKNLQRYPLERIDTPTLIVHGDADTTVPYAHALEAAGTIPNARLLTIKGGTHETLFADGHAVNAIAGFLIEYTARLPEAVVPATAAQSSGDDRCDTTWPLASRVTVRQSAPLRRHN